MKRTTARQYKQRQTVLSSNETILRSYQTHNDEKRRHTYILERSAVTARGVRCRTTTGGSSIATAAVLFRLVVLVLVLHIRIPALRCNMSGAILIFVLVRMHRRMASSRLVPDVKAVLIGCRRMLAAVVTGISHALLVLVLS